MAIPAEGPGAVSVTPGARQSTQAIRNRFVNAFAASSHEEPGLGKAFDIWFLDRNTVGFMSNSSRGFFQPRQLEELLHSPQNPSYSKGTWILPCPRH